MHPQNQGADRLADRSQKSGRFAQKVSRVSRHSNQVRFWRRALPILAASMVLACLAIVLLQRSAAVGLQVDSLGLENGRVVMRNPQVRGASPEGEPFVVRAERATQDPLSPQVVDLENVTAELPFQPGVPGTLTAPSGRYDANGQTVRLDEKIEFSAEDGSLLEMIGARLDLSAGSLESGGEISAAYEGGDLKAGRISVFDHGKRILLTGGVSVTVPPALLAETPAEDPAQ
ncbi:MAG: hypothetical protein AAF141_14820 [Pseudomonadota bacterium]